MRPSRTRGGTAGTRGGLFISVRNEQRAVALPASAVRSALEAARASVLPGFAGEIAVLVTDDARIARLNRMFHGVEGPTDVLSFAEGAGSALERVDIAVSAETARRNSIRYHCTPREELTRYCIHGFLHAAGYGDDTPRGRRRMRETERAILNTLHVHP